MSKALDNSENTTTDVRGGSLHVNVTDVPRYVVAVGEAVQRMTQSGRTCELYAGAWVELARGEAANTVLRCGRRGLSSILVRLAVCDEVGACSAVASNAGAGAAGGGVAVSC
eukprot:scaffold431787_cov39-Prasinocladus_malaysianus.AAC.1